MPQATLIVRTDASVAMGIGHAVRCLALAQAWQDCGGEVVFATADTTPAIDQYLRSQNVGVIKLPVTPGSERDAIQLGQVAHERAARWVVIDGYHFSSNYQRVLKSTGLKVLFVDDIGKAYPYCADIILNQNPTASEQIYEEREPHTRLLLGLRYAMLRREFAAWREWRRGFPTVGSRVLITMGGSDPDGFTFSLIKAFVKVSEPNLQLTVIAGGSNPRTTELLDAINEIAHIKLVADVPEMVRIIAHSDLAILCGGGTLWEALYMGCAVLTYSRPGVQEIISGKLSAAGAILDLGQIKNFNESTVRTAVQNLAASVQRRQSMAARGRELVDGHGTSRVLRSLTESSNDH